MYEKNEPHTAHTYNDVPFLILNKNFKLPASGSLSQIAPTILKTMELPIPEEMTSEPMI
jgi:2,3-bisphosphoglycerate-independent phosphoglycerate mutase